MLGSKRVRTHCTVMRKRRLRGDMTVKGSTSQQQGWALNPGVAHTLKSSPLLTTLGPLRCPRGYSSWPASLKGTGQGCSQRPQDSSCPGSIRVGDWPTWESLLEGPLPKPFTSHLESAILKINGEKVSERKTKSNIPIQRS